MHYFQTTDPHRRSALDSAGGLPSPEILIYPPMYKILMIVQHNFTASLLALLWLGAYFWFDGSATYSPAHADFRSKT